MKAVVHIILTLVALTFVLLLGFIALLFISFTVDGQRFYIPLFFAVLGIVIIAIILFNFVSVRLHRWYRMGIVISLGCCVLAAAGYEANHAYVNSLKIASEQDVNLEMYEPFADETKTVGLSKPSSFRITGEGALPRLDGATALYPVYSAFVQAVYPEKNYPVHDSEVMSSGTATAYKLLITRETDLIFAAAPSEGILQLAGEHSLDLKLTPIGREGFVFFVNTANPVTGLTSEQLKDIYSGKITNWKEVGGRDEEIRAFQRPEDSGSQTMLRKWMGEREPFEPVTEDVAAGMGGIMQQTADYHNYRNAIGFSFNYFATRMNADEGIRLLAVDGIMPNADTISRGSYPITAPFYAVTVEPKYGKGKTGKKKEDESTAKLIRWILSPEGQELVEQTGYAPVNR
ncbi:PstS family phosphate ABC transporter substrate-binding protein [Paenibacillus jiagnxiensis]|uniref:PstS family phosphate ABC transporter substrate-binding protein n=1 Tax=Paenibacillus jiagnxiensis TaxID=3228926 RepID=UPI0033A18CA2